MPGDNTQSAAQPSAPLMPLKGDRTAPTFDPANPHTLPRFLMQVEHLLTRSAIDDQNERKEYLISFVDPDLQDLWEAFPKYTDTNKSFDDLKDALLQSYTDEDNRYGM